LNTSDANGGDSDGNFTNQWLVEHINNKKPGGGWSREAGELKCVCAIFVIEVHKLFLAGSIQQSPKEGQAC